VAELDTCCWCGRTREEHWDVAPAGVTAKVPCGFLKVGFSCAHVGKIEPPAARRPVYVAHPLNAPTAEEREQNRQRAARWCAWLSRRYLIAPVADWIVLSSQWDETAENRAMGLEIDRVLVELCGTIVLVGPRISDGMRFEAEWARVVVDLTGLLSDAPQAYASAGFVLGPIWPEIIDERMAAAGIGRVA